MYLFLYNGIELGNIELGKVKNVVEIYFITKILNGK